MTGRGFISDKEGEKRYKTQISALNAKGGSPEKICQSYIDPSRGFPNVWRANIPDLRSQEVGHSPRISYPSGLSLPFLWFGIVYADNWKGGKDLAF